MSTVDNLSLDLVKIISSYTPKFVYTFYYRGDIYINTDKEKCIKEIVYMMKKYADPDGKFTLYFDTDIDEEYFLEENENETIVTVIIDKRAALKRSIFRKEIN